MPFMHAENTNASQASQAKPRLFVITKVKMQCNAMNYIFVFEINPIQIENIWVKIVKILIDRRNLGSNILINTSRCFK